MYDGKKLCTHQLAENNTYAEVATMLDCTPRTVFNRQKDFHSQNSKDLQLTRQLDKSLKIQRLIRKFYLAKLLEMNCYCSLIIKFMHTNFIKNLIELLPLNYQLLLLS